MLQMTMNQLPTDIGLVTMATDSHSEPEPSPLGTRSPRRPGASRVTMREVATLAGVGIKTVSRVINAEPNVSAATAERVWAAIEALDYHPDMRAGSLRRADGRTRTIAVLVSSVDNPFAGEMQRGVEDEARRRGVVVLAASLDEDPEREIAVLRDLRARHVDGIILATTTDAITHQASVSTMEIPTVFVDRKPSYAKAYSVTSDNREGARRGTAHLISHGHRRIAFLMERSSIPTAAQRYLGFLDALADAGIAATDCPVIEVGSTTLAAEEAITALVKSPNVPTAIFSSQNMLTIGALRALHAAHRQHDIALVGFDDIPLAELLDPPLSAIRQDPTLIGRTVARQLFSLLDGREPTSHHIDVPTRLIIRGSGEIRPDSPAS